MKIFQAYPSNEFLYEYAEVFPDKPLNIIISYAYIKGQLGKIKRLQEKGIVSSLALDSGTYSKNNATAGNHSRYNHVTSLSFKSWTSAFGNNFDHIFNYDIDYSGEDADVNYYNLIELWRAGVEAIPVVHDIKGDEIPSYLDLGVDMLSLGSVQIKKPEDLDTVFDKIAKSNVKIHLLGCTKYKFLIRHPLYSSDSSSASQMGKKFGAVLFWNEAREPDEHGDKTDIINILTPKQLRLRRRFDGIPVDSYQYKEQFLEYLSTDCGLTMKDIIGPHESKLKILNFNYYTILEEKINEYYRRQGWNAY
jgi:hypothetical protein